jgi:hypothetical protein
VMPSPFAEEQEWSDFVNAHVVAGQECDLMGLWSRREELSWVDEKTPVEVHR